MNDVQWEIVKALVLSKKPMRAQHIARELNKEQSHIEYHLKKMIADGRVLVSEDDGVRTYRTQKLISSSKVRNEFKELFLGSMPKLLSYLDLTQSDDSVMAYIQSISDLLCITAQDLKTEMDAIKK